VQLSTLRLRSGGFEWSEAKKFDDAYRKWTKDQRSDRDDIPKDERKMRDIMAHYNIPPDVPFDAVASQGQGRRY